MDKEALSLTEQVLGANPDFSTLWNFRREIFLHMKNEKYVTTQSLIVKLLINQSVSQSINQSINQSVSQSINQSINAYLIDLSL